MGHIECRAAHTYLMNNMPYAVNSVLDQSQCGSMNAMTFKALKDLPQFRRIAAVGAGELLITGTCNSPFQSRLRHNRTSGDAKDLI